MYVIKASGAKELFNTEKLTETLRRIGVLSPRAEEIVSKIVSSLSRRPTSEEVIKRALWELKKDHPALAARYNLKRAIMHLGPTGFPFEKYMSYVLKAYGYQVQTNVHAQGYCVHHELDIVAKKEGRRVMIECKYHNQPGMRSDLKVALYTYARFLDIKKSWEKQPSGKYEFHEGWLITNTKCTTEAIQYASCVGLKIISWRYPENTSLEKLIDNKKLYPITVIMGVNRHIMSRLIDAGFLLVSQLAQADAKEISKKININYRQLYYLIQDAKNLLSRS